MITTASSPDPFLEQHIELTPEDEKLLAKILATESDWNRKGGDLVIKFFPADDCVDFKVGLFIPADTLTLIQSFIMLFFI